jgi:hypothetical protein
MNELDVTTDKILFICNIILTDGLVIDMLQLLILIFDMILIKING